MSAVQKVVLIPRYTTLMPAGPVDYRSAPINVREFASADLTVWRGLMQGVQSFSFRLEESVDLISWSNVEDSDASPAANEESVVSCELELPWIRTVVFLDDIEWDGGLVTCWVVGNFTVRGR